MLSSLALTLDTNRLPSELKQELERWKLVGDATINFAVVLELWLTSDVTRPVSEMNVEKINRIKQENLARTLEQSEWYPKYFKPKEEEKNSRDIC